MPKRTSDENCAQIVACYQRGEKYISFASSLGVGKTTAYNIVRNYKMRQGVPKECRNYKKLIDQEMVQLVLKLMINHSEESLRQILERARNILPEKPHFSLQTLSKTLKKDYPLIFEKCYRGLRPRIGRNSEVVKTKRREFALWMLDTGLSRHRIYVGTKKMTSPLKCTVLAAMSDRVGMLYYETHLTEDAEVTKETFKHFLTSLSAIIGDEPTVVIMDNTRVYKNMHEIFPNLEIKYLPSYSSFLNPLEDYFSSLKIYLTKFFQLIADQYHSVWQNQPIIFQALRQNLLLFCIENALSNVSLTMVCQYYNGANSYLFKCIQNEDL